MHKTRGVLEQRKSDRESARNVNNTRCIVVHPQGLGYVHTDIVFLREREKASVMDMRGSESESLRG